MHEIPEENIIYISPYHIWFKDVDNSLGYAAHNMTPVCGKYDYHNQNLPTNNIWRVYFGNSLVELTSVNSMADAYLYVLERCAYAEHNLLRLGFSTYVIQVGELKYLLCEDFEEN